MKLFTLSMIVVALAACSHSSSPSAATEARKSTAASVRESPCNAQLGQPAPRKFEDYDLNQDGSISYPEYFCGSNRRFNAFDANKDFALGAGTEQKNFGKWKKKADQNNDGHLSAVEYLWAAEQAFKKADKSGDGQLSRAEYRADLP